MRILVGLVCIAVLMSCNSKPEWKPFPLDSLRSFTTVESLVTTFGEDAFIREVHPGNGQTPDLQCIKMWPDTDHTAEFILDDDQVEFRFIELGLNSIWQTRTGIRVGMTIAEIEKLKGESFTFYAANGCIIRNDHPLFDSNTFYFLENTQSLGDPTREENIIESTSPSVQAIRLTTIQVHYPVRTEKDFLVEATSEEVKVKDSLSLTAIRELPLIPLPWEINEQSMPYREYDPEQILGVLGDTTDYFIVVSVGYSGNVITTQGMKFLFRTYDKQGQFMDVNDQFRIGYGAAIETGGYCLNELEDFSVYSLKVGADWSISADDLFIAKICDMRDSIIMKGSGRFERGRMVDVVIDNRETQPNNYLVQ